ncbi:MAG: flagellar motor switch protein FliM [Acidobacteria bacterium]|nr:flagellar motor switch protein FliM [Acidobacteriota bacterium]
MSPQLSQDELDALMLATTGRHGDERRAQHALPATAYNFRRPDRVSKEQLRSLHFLHDRFAVNVSTSLSVFLRAMTEVNIGAVEQFAYSEFLMSLPDPTAFYSIALTPLDGRGALEISPSIAFTMVDRMLGGAGQTAAPNRALTEIEQNVLDSVVRLLLEHLTETWRSIVEVQFRIQGRDTRPQMLQITGPNEVVIALSFDIKLGDRRGGLRLCIPAAAIESMEDKVAQGWHRTRLEPTPLQAAHLHANLGRVPLPVTAQLETRLEARELLALQVGDVVALGHSAADPVDVNVGEVRRFTGRLTRGDRGTAVLIEQVSGTDWMVDAGPGLTAGATERPSVGADA